MVVKSPLRPEKALFLKPQNPFHNVTPWHPEPDLSPLWTSYVSGNVEGLSAKKKQEGLPFVATNHHVQPLEMLLIRLCENNDVIKVQQEELTQLITKHCLHQSL